MASKYTTELCEKEPGFDFVAAHFDCERNPFSQTNPGGFVNLGSAQNFLNEDTIRERITATLWRTTDAKYQSFSGTESCRQSIADYLSASSGADVQPDQIVVGNGAISVLEALAVALLNPHDSVLIPAPVFPGLVNAFKVRQSRRVVLMDCGPDTNFRLSPAALREKLTSLAERGEPVRAILLCSPGNPVGHVLTASEISECIEIALEFDTALIVDEIYASSCFGSTSFTSAISAEADHVFVIGGLSKDFGVAGFATAWLHGRDCSIMRAVASQSHFFRLPAPVQTMTESLLEAEWRDAFIAENRQRLRRSFRLTTEKLGEAGVPVFDAEAGLCLWLDLRHLLPEQEAITEQHLYEFLLNQHRVHVSPGSGFHCSTPGFFRICVAQKEDTLREGLERLVRGLTEFPSSHAQRSMPISVSA